ncbi:YjcQ family protein [Thermoanaerobacterium thermosaccharolyticum]|uniref:YjcQ family protein n=1 Tax=Thermoanaerobacterium thermosaccharolyticum TaxID=1517 RepID=UPI003D2B4D12
MKNQEKILYSLLIEIRDKQNFPTYKDYDISKDEFGHIVEMALEEGYINNAKVLRGGIGNHVHAVLLDYAQITLKGLNYIKENNILAKTYKGLKEIKDWIRL